MFRVTSARREGSSRTAAPCPQTPTPVARLFIRLALALMPALGLGTPAAACPDTASHPANAYWTACLTVGQRADLVGYVQSSDLNFGALDPNSFTVGGQQFGVNGSFSRGLTSTFELYLSPFAPSVAGDWVLQVGETKLKLADAGGMDHFEWSRPPALNWDDDNIGDKVTVSLTLPDVTAPTVTGAEVATDTPDVMVLTFDEALDTGSVPAAGAFTVRVDGSDGPDVTAVAIDSTDATQVRLTLAAAVDAGQTGVTVDYSKPASNPLKDAADNEVADFTVQTVVNNGVPPDNGVPVAPESDLEAPRKEEAAILLRRHVDRFASVSSGAALGRLQGLAPPTTVNAQISARSHKLDASWTDDRAKDSGWAGWSRLFYGWVEGPGDGAIYDLYLGVDWRAPDGRYVIGGMLGHEGADLRLDEGGRFRSQVTQVGLYGATYLSDALILDGALAYGFGKPELSQGGVTAKYDTERLTLRADLTGGLNWREGAVVIEPQAGVLHVQEKLGAFEDSTGAPGAAETLRLTRFGVGPRLTWALPGGVFTGRARLNWDRHNLDGDGDKVSDLSASLDARLRYDLEGGLSAEFFGAADGIGLSGDQQTYTAGVSISFRF